MKQYLDDKSNLKTNFTVKPLNTRVRAFFFSITPKKMTVNS